MAKSSSSARTSSRTTGKKPSRSEISKAVWARKRANGTAKRGSVSATTSSPEPKPADSAGPGQGIHAKLREVRFGEQMAHLLEAARHLGRAEMANEMSGIPSASTQLPPGQYNARISDVSEMGPGKIMFGMQIDPNPRAQAGTPVNPTPAPEKPVIEEKKNRLGQLVKELHDAHKRINDMQVSLHTTDPANAPHFYMMQDLANAWMYYASVTAQIRELTAV